MKSLNHETVIGKEITFLKNALLYAEVILKVIVKNAKMF